MERLEINGLDSFTLPCSIEPRTVKEGLALFSFPEDLINDSQKNSYTICAVDTFNNSSEKEAILIRENNNDQVE